MVATAWVEVAVAATDRNNNKQLGSVGGAVLLAALALPGLCPTVAQAESPPERGSVTVKYLHYKDKQPGFDRITARAPSVSIEAPIGSSWSVSASTVRDSVSGASPRRYTSTAIPSGASRMSEERTAVDGSVTYYRPRSAYSFSLSNSTEHDYKSNAAGVNARFSTDDHNTTVNVGAGWSSDKIGKTGDPDLHETKHTYEMLVGVTQAMTRTDLLQFNIGFSRGAGYFTDPYKYDLRPEDREQWTALLRWNHHFESMGSTLRTSYRYYTDSWSVNSHALQAEWVQPISDQLSLTPLVRYYTQSAASFYLDPRPGTQRAPVHSNEIYSYDQRLSAFGAVTLGLRADYQIDKDWSTDIRGDWYKQRSAWRVGGKVSPDLEPFTATSFQLGVKRAF